MTEDKRYQLHLGDCLEVMRTLADNSVDAIVTDPPYALTGASGSGGFMGSKWDSELPTVEMWKEALRVAKPGAHLLAFGGTRTYHRLACAIEDAGWEIREQLAWTYGCLSEDTEILVNGEWKKYFEVKEDDYALGYDIRTKQFNWQKIARTFLYDYEDTAYHIYSDFTDQLVSRNHRVIVERGRDEVFNLAEVVARECEARVPILEGVQHLLDSLPVYDKRTGNTQQDLLEGMCGRIYSPNTAQTLGRPFTKHEVSGMREDVLCSECLEEKGNGQLLLEKLQGESPYKASSGIQQGTSAYQNREGIGAIERADDGKPKSVLEGRHCAGESSSAQKAGHLDEMSDGVFGDGSTRWVDIRTQTESRTSDRSVAGIPRSGASRGRQSVEQQIGEPNAIQMQCGSQEVRTLWRTRTTLARIEPVGYKGKMWCVTVETGAFVARRNGKVFITGNSGFPKGLNVGKAIEKSQPSENAISEEVALAAQKWEGWNSVLKPAFEPIVLARKPLEGTIVENVLKYGTGAINIDACRVPTEETWTHGATKAKPAAEYDGGWKRVEQQGNPHGRYPANLLHDGSPEVLACFPDVGKSSGGGLHTKGKGDNQQGVAYGKFANGEGPDKVGFGDSGSAARFFNCLRDGEASAERRYTEKGNTNFAMKPGMRRPPTSPARFFYCAKASRSERGEGNIHPTVKPLALMRWCVTLVAPPDSVVLDPFMGSGSTGIAALQCGCRFVGIEREPEYMAIAERRIAAALDEPPQTAADASRGGDAPPSPPPVPDSPDSGDSSPRPPTLQQGELPL